MMSMYRVLSYGLLIWAFMIFAGIVGTVIEAGFGVNIPAISFDQSRPDAPAPAGVMGFVIFTMVSLVLVATFLQGAKTVRGLETIRENWSESARALRRLALLLLASTLAQFIGGSIIGSIATSRELGTFGIVALVDVSELSQAFIALIIFLAARALDLATREIEENRTFL